MSIRNLLVLLVILLKKSVSLVLVVQCVKSQLYVESCFMYVTIFQKFQKRHDWNTEGAFCKRHRGTGFYSLFSVSTNLHET